MTIPLLTEVGARALQKRIESYSGDLNGEATVAHVPELKDIRLTGREVLRDGRTIGYLGRTFRGRFLLLQPVSSDSQAEIARMHRLNILAKQGLAIPYWGLVRSKGRRYWARPLVAGHLPIRSLERGNYALASQLDDLHRLRHAMKTIDPFFSEGVLYTPKLIADRSIDLSTMALSEADIIEWRNFLQPLAFVASADGRLLLENPVMSPNVTAGYIVRRAPEAITWPLNRWSGYAYFLMRQMSDEERLKAVMQMRQPRDQQKTVDSIRNLWDITVINDILQRSSDWRAGTFHLNVTQQESILDRAQPHPRPQILKFKSKEKLNYHAKKHASEFGLSKADEYMTSAIDFVQAPPSGNRQYFVRENAQIVVYDPDSSTFAVFTPEGTLLTYMRPSTKFNGHSYDMLYFLEQFAKGSGFFETRDEE